MCGIAGFIGEDKALIDRMTAALIHRGPDGNATYVGHNLSFGHARLAILDPRPDGNQPMWSDDKKVIMVYNGEIFNYRRLREEEKFDCRTGTDTEVLIKLYQRYGLDFLHRLHGMFALAIYDFDTQELHLARDNSGIKPLYITTIDGRVHFASEMRALLSAFPVKPSINTRALSQYMRLMYVPGPDTLCEGIQSLQPGICSTWTHEGQIREMSITPQVDVPTFSSAAQFKAEFPEFMQNVVADHLISDKPVGIFLSGGMDSSIVLHHMAKAHSGTLNSFTVRFDATEEEGAARFNADANMAKTTASHYGTTHHEVYLSAELCRDVYRDTARAIDMPNADSVAMAQFVLSREAKKSVDVVLTGAGGDELFGGYPRYRIAHILQSLRHIPPFLRSTAGSVLGYPADVLGLSPGAALAERLLARPTADITEVARGDWFAPDAVTQLFHEWFSRLSQHEAVRAFMEFDRHTWLTDESLRLTDATTMASSVEGRVPFLDARTIAVSHNTPATWHLSYTNTKTLLKETYHPLLPPHLSTLKKACFYPPLAKWFRREVGSVFTETLESKRIAEFFDIDACRLIYEQHCRTERYNYHVIAMLAQLSAWFDTVYDA